MFVDSIFDLSKANKIVYLLKTEKQAPSSVEEVYDISRERDNADDYIESGRYASAIRSVVNTKSLSVPRLNGHLYQSGVRLERYNLSIDQISTQSYEEFMLGQAVLVSPDFTDNLGTSGSGEVRRGKDGKMYVNLAGDQDLYVYNNPLDPNPTRTDIPFATGSMGGGGLPIQPLKERNVVEVHHRKLGKKFYELTDHLGNVRVVFSDRKIAEDTDSNGDIDAYSLDVRSWSDYYAFGMPMPGRTYNPQEYRFGFNGMESDDEITETSGSHLDFGARVYDSRIGRWTALEPLAAKYPEVSPYCFVKNMPIIAKDPDGKDVYIVIYSEERPIKAAAATRIREIENSPDFVQGRDNVYPVAIEDLGTLGDRISQIMTHAEEMGYGKTVELSVYSHGASKDGPIGDEPTTGEDKKDNLQLSFNGWDKIDFNFDEENSIAAFYGCQLSGWIKRFADYTDTNVRYLAAYGPKVRATEDLEELDPIRKPKEGQDVYMIGILVDNKHNWIGWSKLFILEKYEFYDYSRGRMNQGTRHVRHNILTNTYVKDGEVDGIQEEKTESPTE